MVIIHESLKISTRHLNLLELFLTYPDRASVCWGHLREGGGGQISSPLFNSLKVNDNETLIVYNREIKHHVYGKRKRQNYHVIMNFSPFFTFAVCRFQREEPCSRVRQQHEYIFFEVFDSFCYNYQLVFKPIDVLFILLRKLTG